MKVEDVNEHGVLLFLTPAELLMAANALNEVCNALEVPEFATRMGVEREEALHLLKNLSDLYDKVVREHEVTPSP